MVRRQDDSEPLRTRIAADAERLGREVRFVSTQDASSDRGVAQLRAHTGEDRQLADAVGDPPLRRAPRLIFAGAGVRIELWTSRSRQHLPARTVAAHAADPLDRATDLDRERRRVVARRLALHEHAAESIERPAAATLAARPRATEQVRLGGAVALQSRHRRGVDEHLSRVVAMRTAHQAVDAQVERRELHVDDEVVPRWRHAVGTRERRRRMYRFRRVDRSGEELRQRVAPRQEIDGAVRLVLRVAHHRLLDQLHAAPHRLERAARRVQTARLLPAVRDLDPRGNLRLEEREDAGLEGVPLREEESAKVVWARRLRVHLGVLLEALRLAVHLEPVEQRIATEPVARLGGGDPPLPRRAVAVRW